MATKTKRTVTLKIEVTTSCKMDNQTIEKLVDMMLNSGYDDAQQTLESGEGDMDAAEAVTSLTVTAPKVDYLLAAAPDLLEALAMAEGALSAWMDRGNKNIVPMVQHIRAAIAKAKNY